MLRPLMLRRLSVPLAVAVLAVCGLADLAKPQTEVKFGRDVRPILSQHCFKCHGPDVQTAAAGLRLDSFAGATAKLGSGPTVVPGKPTASRLLNRVSEPNAALRMPPPGAGVQPLTKSQIETLKQWISQGAKYEAHWAYVAPKLPSAPKVSNTQWAKNPIDLFVLNKLENASLKPEAEAPKDTLAMRAAQALTGLPPSPAELNTFRRDSKPGAYERYVDRLMAKPEYGEHQARYWLDAVRYGDTHGLQLDNERAVFPYRDWVIRAFNQDLPYNKFIQWQLAGDLLPNPTTEQLIATGYVRMNLTSNEGGAIAEEFLARNTFDRVDTTSTVLLGLTVACAKCHDHKYDPIRQKEYYGLYAFFNSTQDEPLDGNIALPPPFIPAPDPSQVARFASIDAELKRLRAAVNPEQATGWLKSSSSVVPEARDWEISPVYSASNFDEAFDLAKPGEPGQPTTTWKPLNLELGKDTPNLIGRDNSFVYVRGKVISEKAQTLVLQVGSDDGIRLWLNGKQIHSHKIGRGLAAGSDSVRAEFRAGENELIAKVVNGISIDGLRIAFGNLSEEILAKAQSAPKTEKVIEDAFLSIGPDSAQALAYRRLNRERSNLESSLPMTLIAREMAKPRPTFILKRGQYDQKGGRVDRMLPSILGRLPAKAPVNRLGLANWLTDPKNPLVARVFVNRVWQQYFGTGIVKTVEDFGSQGEWPQNQALLDYLAVRFTQQGWSIKQLNRMIVTSAAFRQASRVTKAKLAKDPENRLISRGPRFRLDAEAIRDKALYAAGLLVQKTGGRGFKPYQPDGLWEGSSDPASSTHFYVRDQNQEIYRRSLYMFWKRTSPPPVMVTFDAPLRDACTVRRSATNTPLQALALMNETAFWEASRVMADRLLSARGTDASRLNRAYELALGRPPAADEQKLLLKAVQRYRKLYAEDPAAAQRLLEVGDSPRSKANNLADQAAWTIVCSTLMNTNEFVTQH
ncbi:MAG: PSD1 and planctomycete cytochrome C domain-containing protein [Fimbriimonas sp.]